MNINHLIFLIHPCCYERIDKDAVRRDNLQFFVDLERKIKARWLAALAKGPANTLLVQLGGPDDLRQAAVAGLGEAGVFYPKTQFPENQDLREYYRRLAADFHAHVAAHSLHFDPAVVTSELWGESFEGCVPGYGGAFAEYLQLKIPPRMRFEMTVHDSRCLIGAGEPEVIPIDNSDVEAWLFQCQDSTAITIFQSRLKGQWVDERRVSLMLDDRRIQVCSKLGHTLWPDTPWKKHKPEQVLEYSMTLAESIWHWIRAAGMHVDDFREVIRATRVLAASP
jgi:hypothetical protein